MKSSKKRSTSPAGNALSGVPEEIKASGRGKKPSHENQPRRTPLRWGAALARRHTLLGATLGYFLVVTSLLLVDSPRQLLSHFITTGPSLDTFARAHQTALHFLSFYLLAILACSCFRHSGYLMATLFMVAFAIVTELAQIPLPHRHSDPIDLLANFTGIGCGVASAWALFRVTSASLWKRNSLRG